MGTQQFSFSSKALNSGARSNSAEGIDASAYAKLPASAPEEGLPAPLHGLQTGGNGSTSKVSAPKVSRPLARMGDCIFSPPLLMLHSGKRAALRALPSKGAHCGTADINRRDPSGGSNKLGCNACPPCSC